MSYCDYPAFDSSHHSKSAVGHQRLCAGRYCLRAVWLVLTVVVAGLLLPVATRAADRHIATIHITTANGQPIVSRQWQSHTRIEVVGADGYTLFTDPDVQVKAYGNSSYNKPKKPLTLKFAHEVSMLGMTPNRRWYLVTNFMDHSLLRNALALSVARQTSLEWTSDWRMVNVVENGQPRGCYLMAEEIHVGSQWVDAHPDKGFLVELDAYPDDGPRFTTDRRRLPVNLRHPANATDRQKGSIKARFDRIEAALYGAGAATLDKLYAEDIDLDSFVDYFIVQEICQNAECNGPRSTYMYLARDGRLHAGPVWDFDLAFNDVGLDSLGDIRPARFRLDNVRPLTANSLYNDRALWYDRLTADPTFCRRLHERWALLRPRFAALTDSLTQWTVEIAPSAQADQLMWGSKDPARFDNHTAFEPAAENLRQVYLRRLDKLDGLFGRLAAAAARPATPRHTHHQPSLR